MGKLPLVMLSASTADAVALEEHSRDAVLSGCAAHRIVAGSGHWMHLDEPEEVVKAIREVAGAIKKAAGF